MKSHYEDLTGQRFGLVDIPNRTIDELFAPVNCQFRGKRE